MKKQLALVLCLLPSLALGQQLTPPPGSGGTGPITGGNCSANQFITALNTVGDITCTQPAIGGISGLGSGVATALGVNTNGAGAIVLFNGALGTPSSGVGTNLTNLPAASITGTLPTSHGGTGVTTSWTAGSIPFINSSNVFAQDNSNLFWDASSHFLGIGRNPGTLVDLFGASPLLRISDSGTSFGYISIVTNGTSALFGKEGAGGGNLMGGSTANSTIINSAGNLPLYLGTNNTARVTILGNGDTGFGTTSPTNTVSVTGTGNFTGNVGFGQATPTTPVDVVGVARADVGRFKGLPWADVQDWCGAPNNPASDYKTCITSAMNYLNSTYGAGGIIFFPVGNWFICSEVEVLYPILFWGSGPGSTTLGACSDGMGGNVDTTVLHFNGGSNAGFRDITIQGSLSASSTQSVVLADTGFFAQRCNVWGGAAAINQRNSVDGSVIDCYVFASATTGSSISSNGANWYIRVKVDIGADPVLNGFFQGAPSANCTATCENHFEQSDFSGNYTNAILIDDGATGNAVTVFSGSVSGPVNIAHARWTSFVGHEFGGAIVTQNDLSIVGSAAFSATTVTGGGLRQCGGNFRITC